MSKYSRESSHQASFNLSSSQLLYHLVTPPLLRVSCPRIQQPVQTKLRCPAPYPMSRSLAGKPGLHLVPINIPELCQGWAGLHCLGEILPEVGTEQLPSVSCLLPVLFVWLFFPCL